MKGETLESNCLFLQFWSPEEWTIIMSLSMMLSVRIDDTELVLVCDGGKHRLDALRQGEAALMDASNDSAEKTVTRRLLVFVTRLVKTASECCWLTSSVCSFKI